MKPYLFSIILLLTFSLTTFCQSKEEISPCGTIETEERLIALKAFQDMYYNNAKFVQNTDLKYIPMTMHITSKSDGTSKARTYNQALDLLCHTNEQFENSNAQIQFTWKAFNDIANDNWHQGDGNANTVMPAIYQNNPFLNPALHSYMQNVSKSGGTTVCGVYVGVVDAVFLTKNCIGPVSSTWAHELGHYLSLPHTFSGWEGQSYSCNTNAPGWAERVDGSNCFLTAGSDGFCDTPPDYLNYRWNCSNGQSLFCPQKDVTGAEFYSDGSYFMSYSDDACQNKFSPDQVAAMHHNIETRRPNLIQSTPDWGDITETPTLIQPINDAQVQGYDATTLYWGNVDNATHYVLEVAINQSFSVGYKEYIVQWNQQTVTDLLPNRRYFWRVRPFNKGDICEPISSSESFMTPDWTVGVQTIEGLGSLTVQPNPARANQNVIVSIQTQKVIDGTINVYDLTGKLITSKVINLIVGVNEETIDTTDLGQGMYIVSIQTEKGVMNQKMIITQ